MARIAGLAMPDRSCCSMPDSVWYRPVLEEDAGTRTDGVLVGFSSEVRYRDAARKADAAREPGRRPAPRWTRREENNAFLGRFELRAE